MTLLVLIAVLRIWLLFNTEVTARDSIGFIRYAVSFDHKGWSGTLNSQDQHPGYPVALWLMAKPIRAIWGATPETMRVAAQLVSILASLGLAVLMFRIGKFLWDRYIGFFAALLFQCFPIPGHHLSDGISDGLFLLLMFSAFDTLIRARASGSVGRYTLGGALVGLAYLVRPEGLLLMPVLWLFIIALEFTREHRTTWRGAFKNLAVASLACVVAGSPYVLTTGRITRKDSVRQTVGWERQQHHLPNAEMQSAIDSRSSALFAATFVHSDDRVVQLQRTVRALLLELGQSFNYIGGFVALWALIFCRKTLTRNVGFYLLAIYFLAHSAVLLNLGLKVNYVSDRHVMILVALGCYLCVIGMLHLNTPWIRWVKANPIPSAGYLQPRVLHMAAGFYLLLSMSICVGKTATRLHANRQGNHEAGLWLAKSVAVGDIIHDDHCWSHYYAGHVFLEGKEIVVPPDVIPTHFYVMTRSRDDDVRVKRESQEAQLRNSNAQLVYHWPTKSSPETARIVIYAMPRNFDVHPWIKGEPGVFQTVGRKN